jgi:hypothetical protein
MDSFSHIRKVPLAKSGRFLGTRSRDLAFRETIVKTPRCQECAPTDRCNVVKQNVCMCSPCVIGAIDEPASISVCAVRRLFTSPQRTRRRDYYNGNGEPPPAATTTFYGHHNHIAEIATTHNIGTKRSSSSFSRQQQQQRRSWWQNVLRYRAAAACCY